MNPRRAYLKEKKILRKVSEFLSLSSVIIFKKYKNKYIFSTKKCFFKRKEKFLKIVNEFLFTQLAGETKRKHDFRNTIDQGINLDYNAMLQ